MAYRQPTDIEIRDKLKVECPDLIKQAGLTQLDFGKLFLNSEGEAILGTLEPVTALFFGVTVFHEVLTFKIICGIILILLAVIGVILKPDYHKWIFLKPGHDTETGESN